MLGDRGKGPVCRRDLNELVSRPILSEPQQMEDLIEIIARQVKRQIPRARGDSSPQEGDAQ
jgi:hypothetical protein